MEYEKIKHMIVSNQMIVAGIGLCLLFWIVESILHVFVFHEGDFIRQLFPSDSDEIWMRLVMFGTLILFRVYAQFTINKRRQAEVAI